MESDTALPIHAFMAENNTSLFLCINMHTGETMHKLFSSYNYNGIEIKVGPVLGRENHATYFTDGLCTLREDGSSGSS